MDIQIDNFRGIKHAEIDLRRFAFIGGPNAAGKSSIAQAAGALLTGQTVPIAIKKTEAGMLVHAGTGRGEIVLTTTGGRFAIAYPSAVATSDGVPPAATLFAVGFKSILDLDLRERAAVMASDYLKSSPTPEDVIAAATGIGLSAAAAGELNKLIVKLGWDGAHNQAKESGIKLKGQWELTTAERYGSSKADSWIPSGWDEDLTAASDESLQAQHTQEREFLEAAIASSAVDDAQRDQLRDAAGKIDDYAAKERDKRVTLAAALNRHTQATVILRRLPRAAADAVTASCPHCGLAVIVDGIALRKPEAIDDADVEAKRLAIAGAQAVVDQTAKIAEAEQKAAADALRNLELAQSAKKRYDALPAPSAAVDIEAARERVAVAERRSKAFAAKREADRLHANIGMNAKVQALLATDGLRLRKLREAIAVFNTRLATLSAAAKWKPVTLGDDLSVHYGGAPIVLLSKSEEYRVRLTVQAAMAQIDGSAAIIADGADILDVPGRNGLMRMLASTDIQSIMICLTLREAKELPSVPESFGTSYWIEGGCAEPMF